MRYVAMFDTDAPMPQFGHGIWDNTGREWVAQYLAGEVASWHAAILSLRYDENGDRPGGTATPQFMRSGASLRAGPKLSCCTCRSRSLMTSTATSPTSSATLATAADWRPQPPSGR
jgi:hypothetical protein